MKVTAVLFFVSLIMNSTVLVAAVENSHVSVGPSAQQQSEAAADIEITRNIRKSLMQNKSLSIQSKNIQIVTIQGEVTLKGSVPSVREQKEIVQIAQSVAGVNSLFNQTEIKGKE